MIAKKESASEATRLRGSIKALIDERRKLRARVAKLEVQNRRLTDALDALRKLVFPTRDVPMREG